MKTAILRKRRFPLALMFVLSGLIFAAAVHAQGALTFSNMPPANPTSSGAGSGGTGTSVDVVNGPIPIVIYRVGTVPATAGTYTVHVSTRIGGAFTANPPTAASMLQGSGWTLHGTASTTFTSTTTPTQIPVDINLTVPPATRVGVAIVLVAGNARYVAASGLPSPAITANADLEIHWQGIAGSLSTVVGSPQHVGSFAPRGPILQVWYDLAQVQGPSAQITSVGVAGGLPGTGNNTVTCVLRNNGTTDLSNTNFTLEYSTDGTTWVGTTVVTPTSFPALANVNHTFALPWNISAIGTQTLSARIASTPGSASPPAVKTYTPNAIIETVTTTPVNPVVAPNTVNFTVKNTGSFSLNSAPLTFRYTTDAGQNYVSQPFIPSTLGTTDSTESFSFTTAWFLASPGPATLTVDMNPSITAGTISKTVTYPNAGLLITTHNFAPGPNGGANTYPFGNPQCKKQVQYSPAQLNNLSGPITQIGVMMSAAFTGVTWPDVRIEMGESTLMGTTTTTSFDGNYNVPSKPKTTVYSGSLTLTNPAANDYAMITLQTPYDYSGLNNLVITFYVNGAASSTGLGYLVPSSLSTNYRLYANASGDAAVGTLGASWALNTRFVFNLGVTGQSLRIIDIGHGEVTDAASVASKPVKVKVRNNGTFNFTGQPVPMEYSTNGGTTWLPQTFTPTALYSLFEETFAFTVPWNVTAVGAEQLMVRFQAPGIGTTDQSRTENYVPDLDITAIDTVPALPIAGANTVSVTVKNNGTFLLTGQSVGLRYTTNAGLNYTTQSFPMTTLATPGATETFSFTSQWTASVGNFTVAADINPMVAGDPDTTDVFSRLYSGVGYSVAEPNTAATEAPSHLQPNSGSGWPVNTWWHDFRLECVYLASELTAAGMSAGSAIAQIQLRCSDLPLMELQNFRVRMQLTTASAPGTAFVPSGWTDVYGPTTLPVSTFTVGDWFSLPLSPNFVWDGTSNLLIDFTQDANAYVGNGGVFLRTFTTPRARQGYDDSGSSYPFDTVANQSNVNYVPSIRLFHGNALLVSDLNLEVNYTRVNGTKDAYRGENLNLKVELNNPKAYAINFTGFDLAALDNSGIPVSGITFTLPTFPVTVAPSASMTLNIPVAISPTAGGAQGERVNIRMLNAAAVDPAAPTANPLVVGVLDVSEGFDLFNGPAPSQLVITLTGFNPVVETVPFLQNLTVTGGTGTYVWSIPATSQHSLPTGLALSPNGSAFLDANISGTPASGTSAQSPYNLTLEVTDSFYVRTVTLPMVVTQRLNLEFPPNPLANGQEYTPYSMTTPFTASGGSLIYTFGVDPSSTDQLPAGLTLNPVTGVISGIPADGTQGTYNITFMLDDGQQQLTQPQALTITPHPLVWRSTSVPTATQTVAYSAMLDAIGGTGPRTYSIDSGTLPNGLSLNSATGAITGVPSLVPPTVGVYNMVFKVTDGVPISATQAMTIEVIVAAPLTLNSLVLPSAECGMAYSTQIHITGGSENYSVVLAASAATLPDGLTLSPSGVISGTPGLAADGHYDLDITINDGFQTIPRTISLAVLPRFAGNVRVTEVDTGTGYVEIAATGTEPADVSGWSLLLWVDGNSPLSLPMTVVPGASILIPGEVLTFSVGGTAGGSWPNFATGGSWSATATSNLAVLLSDMHGNPVSFAAFGTVNIPALLVPSTAPLVLPGAMANVTPAANGSANYSLAATGWVGAAAGSQGVQNPGLNPAPLDIAKDDLRPVRSGAEYRDWVFAAGGRAPYTYSILSPSAPWLSINSATGELTGTAGTAGAKNVDITVTDADMLAVTRTASLFVFGASTPGQATFAVGTGEGQSFEGSTVAVPVTMTRSPTAPDINGFSFTIELPAATTAELEIMRVTPGAALLAAGRTLAARQTGNGRIFVGDMEGSGQMSPILDGVVAWVWLRVPSDDNVMAPEATYAVNISGTTVATGTTPFVGVADGTNGAAVLSNYKPQDVNRDDAIDVVDVQMTVNIILQIQQPTYTGQGDANEDSQVDVVDVQTIVNCILQSNCN